MFLRDCAHILTRRGTWPRFLRYSSVLHDKGRCGGKGGNTHPGLQYASTRYMHFVVSAAPGGSRFYFIEGRKMEGIGDTSRRFPARIARDQPRARNLDFPVSQFEVVPAISSCSTHATPTTAGMNTALWRRSNGKRSIACGQTK